MLLSWKMRKEQDLLGYVEIETEAAYGSQTQRTLNTYPTAHVKTLGDYPLFLQSLLQLKKACALTNFKNNELSPSNAEAITAVIDNLLDELATSAQHYFRIHAYHGGGGVGINMNLNEVIANLANQLYFDRPYGTYSPIHPNNHINLNNSTSDVIKTSIHITVIKIWEKLKQSIHHLEQSINGFILQYGTEKKISRTCLQDAVEISFGQMFEGYLYSISRHLKELQHNVNELHGINLGGNIIGRPGDCSAEFYENILYQLSSVTQNTQLFRVDNLFEASQNNDVLIRFASGLSQFSSTLIKIAKDLRLMSSGPETGFKELILPAVQQGSSAMPGKINPNIPEYVIQTAFHVIGLCHSIQITQMHDELDYSPWQTFVATQLFDAMHLIMDAIQTFSEHCIIGLQPNTAQNLKNLESIIPTMVQLSKQLGYAEASNIYKKYNGNLDQIRAFIRSSQGN